MVGFVCWAFLFISIPPSPGLAAADAREVIQKGTKELNIQAFEKGYEYGIRDSQ